MTIWIIIAILLVLGVKDCTQGKKLLIFDANMIFKTNSKKLLEISFDRKDLNPQPCLDQSEVGSKIWHFGQHYFDSELALLTQDLGHLHY